MKECPVCKATCFDDMEVCYGCLHRFGSQGDGEQLPAEKMSEALASARSLQLPHDEEGDGIKEKAERHAARFEPNVEMLPAVQGAHVKARHAAVRPEASLQTLGSKVPSPLDVPADAIVIPGDACSQDEWVLRVALPSSCEGVTVRLERA